MSGSSAVLWRPARALNQSVSVGEAVVCEGRSAAHPGNHTTLSTTILIQRHILGAHSTLGVREGGRQQVMCECVGVYVCVCVYERERDAGTCL